MKTKDIAAFQFPEVRVVEASAGSGKTYALAKRYVQLLLMPQDHNETIPLKSVLAITFTNKASFEMKERILEFLKKIAFNQFAPKEFEDILSPTGLSKEEASQKAYRLMEDIIRNYNFFQVQTIDSFIKALLTGCSARLKLSSRYKIKTDTTEDLDYCLDQLINKSLTDKHIRAVFERFLHQYLILENNSKWFPKKDILDLIHAFRKQSSTYGMEFRSFDTKDEDIFGKKGYALSLMRELYDILPEKTDKKFEKILDSFLEANKKVFFINHLSSYFHREIFPANKGADIPPKVQDLWDKIRGELTQICELEAFSLFNPYIEIYNLVNEELKAKVIKDDVLYLEELNSKAQELYKNGITVDEIYYRMATRFMHYLIDEFQDTNFLQWKNFKMLIEEALSKGGSLFYVGDKKQAIFGFRGGEAKLFDLIPGELENTPTQKEFLNVNYRSQKAIVDFNNQVFSGQNLDNFFRVKDSYEVEKKREDYMSLSPDDELLITDTFKTSFQKARDERPDGFVRVTRIDEDLKSDIIGKVRGDLIPLIRDLKQRYEYSDMAVMARNNNDLEEITGWLLEEGIPVESERTLDITENPLIRELTCLLTFLNSPIDNLSFAQFVTGRIFLKKTGIPEGEIHSFLFSLREALYKQEGFYIYKEFRKKYPDIWERCFEEFFKNVGLYPLYELVVTILSRYEVLKNFKEAQGFIMHFLEIIKSKEEDVRDIATFIEQFETLEKGEMYTRVTSRKAVKLLTIHKAKGLEFPAVIIPSLVMDINVGVRGDMGQQSFIMAPRDGALQLYRIKNDYLPFSEKLTAIKHEDYVKALSSELNNIYVGLTRASEELYIFIPKKVGGSFNLANFLIPGDPAKFGTLNSEKFYSKDESKEHLLPLGLSNYQDLIDFLKDEFDEEDQVTHREQRMKGKALHYLLSKVGNLTGGDKDEVLTSALEAAACEFPHIKDLSLYLKTVDTLISKEEIRPYFYVNAGEVYQEKDIVNRHGHTKRPDRLIINNAEVIVIDYKSSLEVDARQSEQVKEYMAILKEIYPKKEVRGILIYLEEGSVVQVKEDT